MALVVDGAPTYEEWRAAEVERAEDGTWILEGDIRIVNEDQLRAIYLRYFAQPAPPGTISHRSAARCVGEFDNVWDVAEKLDLTYCLGDFYTEGLEDKVKVQLEKATAVWERAGDVNFIHVDLPKSQCNCLFMKDEMNNPDDCIARSGAARIRVRELVKADCGATCPPASAHYPHSSDSDEYAQEILFHEFDVEELPRHAIHELGHALGLRHEHARWTQTADFCWEDKNWRSVTDRDPDSVMGYGSCKGTSGVVFSPEGPSSLDRMGLAYLYNLPRTEFPSYTSAEVDDILWYQPERGKYVLWRAVEQAAPGSPIEFAEQVEFCPDGEDAEDCAWGGGHRSRVKPIPVAMTAGHLADVVAYGPEGASDAVLLHTATGPLEYHPGAISGSFDLPLIGRFALAKPTEDVWWVRPGQSSDHLGTFAGNYTVSLAPNDDYGAGISSDSWYLPLVGLWAARGSGRPNSQIVWLRERSKQFLLSYQSLDGLTMEEEMVTPTCLFFENVRQPIALRGDFDGDDLPEIFWVSLSNGKHVLWRDTARMWRKDPPANCNDPTIAAVITDPGPSGYQIDLTFVKPFVGDFDGDGSDDIFWYTPGDSPDVIWTKVGTLDALQQPNGPLAYLPIVDGMATTIEDDYSPLVGDYNGDGCDDILWFAPHTDYTDFDPTEGVHVPNVSPLWRANCGNNFTGFTEEVSAPSAPSGAYPVGYDPRTAGRYSEISLPVEGM